MITHNRHHNNVAFTGYRTSKILDSSNDKQIIETLKKRLDHTIETLYNRGMRNFISGAASGFDTYAALAIIKARDSKPDISLTLAIPFMGHDTKFSPLQKSNFEKISTSANQIVYVSQKYHNNAYLDRNNYMLQNSSILVCYFDGQRGGTMYTVNRALKIGHEIINLHDEYQIKKSDTQLSLF